ncbi:site-specific DNA-methyltransferase [Bisgaard Taxon 46]
MTLPVQHLFSEQTENPSITLLKQLFPQCFDKNGAFLPEKMAELMPSTGVDVSREAYSLNWLGKSYARYLRDCYPTTLLNEDQPHNSQPQNQHSQNLLIKGDNLEVLKHLKNAYANKVKMIYIDPPYNTGSDGFVYQDDRKFSPEQFAELAKISIEESRRILDFTAKKSNSHSAWLTFMYPRLYIARELLKEDGVIFISIDDNEQAQLKLLCDDVFGEENFIDTVIVRKSANGMGSKDGYSTNHDFLLVYQKNKKDNSFLGIRVSEDYIESFNKQDEFGNYKTDGLFRKKGRGARREDSPNCFYPIYADLKSGRVFLENNQENLKTIFPKLPNGGDGRWVWSKEFAEPIMHRLYSSQKGTVYIKDYWNDDLREKPRSILDDNSYLNDMATNEIIDLFGSKVFSTPKPLGLLIDLIDVCVHLDEIVLDFFSGSATTAHAVMKLNQLDEQKRKFICVQIPEDLDEAYKKSSSDGKEIIKNAISYLDCENKPHCLFEITKARIEKSAVKIQQDFPDYQGDLGFKIFETVPNFRLAQEDENLSPQMALPDSLNANLNEEQYHTLLTTWRVFDGNALTDSVQAVKLGDYVANLCGHTLYFIQAGFDSLAIKALIEKLDKDKAFLPERIVLFGANVESAKQKELKQALDSYTNRKKLNIALLVRY